MAHFEFYPDALHDSFALFLDDVRRIPSWREMFAEGPSVSAVRVSASTLHGQPLAELVSAARILFFSPAILTQSSRLWLFLAHLPWQDDTSVVNYRRIWNDCSLREIALPEANRGPEVRVEIPGYVRYATAGFVDEASLGQAIACCCQATIAAFLIVTKDDLMTDANISRLHCDALTSDTGTLDTYVNWGRLIHRRATNGDLIAKRTRYFNEQEPAIDVFARSDTLTSLMTGAGIALENL